METSNSPNALSAKGWFDRGNDCKRAGDVAGALDAYRSSLKLNPRAAAPWIGLAQVLDANQQFEDARQCLKRATLAEPRNLLARQNLANAHKNLGHVEDARREFEAALSIAPDSAAIHFGLGHLHEDLGEPEEAVESYRAALVIAPDAAEAMGNLLGLGRHVDISGEIDLAQKQMAGDDHRKRALIGYGLGKALDQQQSYDGAFAVYQLANDARRALSGKFDRDVFDRRITSMIDLFSERFFEERRSTGETANRPVFIVGLPRSGTTLTEQILASHPQCFGAGELNALSDLATGTPDRLGNADKNWPFCVRDLSPEHFSAIAREYLAISGQRAPKGAQRVVDKQPLNFWHLGLIALAMPNARIIHCTRDIRDCGLSIYTQNFSVQQAWSTDLADIAYYWQGYLRLMKHWSAASGLQILDLAYEETVTELESQARHLLDFVGLPWDDRVLQFHQSDRAVQTPSRWQVRQPVYQSSKARWRNYEKHLGPLLEAAKAQE